MPTFSRGRESDQLRHIKSLRELIPFLRDELDWPIDSEDIEDVTYEFTPEELKIEKEHAVKIKEIKQLRPLASNQPWGIFWIGFEKKKLPVVVLRRILSSLVLKKRTDGSKSLQAAWKSQDLLFLSAYGESENRELAIAHFSDVSEGHAPTLRVLQWDDDDTALKLDDTLETLRTRMRWKNDFTRNAEAWKKEWSGAFQIRYGHAIKTSKELAGALAIAAKRIRNRIRSILRMEDGHGQMRRLQRAFQTALIHDLNDDGFADMFAQTVTYGLFSLACRRTIPGEGTAFVKDDLSHYFTSPFLQEMLGIFLGVNTRKGKIDFDELGISEVTDLLTKEAHMESVLADFGHKTRDEDPVVHFYENFLTAYNKTLKVQRGVFYTPQPVVSYIVRSVHELLQTEFGLTDGLADTTTWGEMLKKHPDLKLPPLTDEPGEQRTISPEEPFVQILDPATGTGTFIVEVIDVIHRTLIEKWKSYPAKKQIELWNDYVPKYLLPRLHAYELMMAPYAIAHMKIGLKLAETGYNFKTGERARIYLTNALEPKVRQLPQIGFEALAQEAAAVNEIKWYKRFTVVIGNPPYSNFGKLNKIPFILNLLDDYKRGLNEKKINLDDDFIKFVRFSHHLIDRSGVGVLGLITNNVYVDGVTHRRMRESLMETFDVIRILDLHGSSKRLEHALGGDKEENVFDITVGVGIGLFTCSLARKKTQIVMHSELWGERPAKYQVLLASSAVGTQWETLSPTLPHLFFIPKNFDLLTEYQHCIAVQEVFPVFSSGIQTKRDNVAISETKESLLTTLKDFARLSASELRSRYNLPDDGRDWRIEWASVHAREILKSPETVAPILYRPFDSRWTVMDSKSKGFVSYPRFEVMSQMIHKNLALIVTRQLSLPTFQHVFATRQLIDGNTISLQTREYNYLFPLYIRGEQSNQRSLAFESHNKANLGEVFLKALTNGLKLRHGSNDLPNDLKAEDIFYYVYAVLHSPGYRSRYAEFLKIDFPRLPLIGNLELFKQLSYLGGELVTFHLLESKSLDRPMTHYVGTSCEVERVAWENRTVWIDAPIAKKGRTQAPGTSGFQGIPEEVWNFHIGGYQVCEKWLKDRKGRTLTAEDISHYHKIVVALSETIRIMKEIDEVIDKHGGWPEAFQSRKGDNQ